MKARGMLMEALLKVITKEAVQEACDHVIEILRLCYSDNMGMVSHSLLL